MRLIDRLIIDEHELIPTPEDIAEQGFNVYEVSVLPIIENPIDLNYGKFISYCKDNKIKTIFAYRPYCLDKDIYNEIIGLHSGPYSDNTSQEPLITYNDIVKGIHTNFWETLGKLEDQYDPEVYKHLGKITLFVKGDKTDIRCELEYYPEIIIPEDITSICNLHPFSFLGGYFHVGMLSSEEELYWIVDAIDRHIPEILDGELKKQGKEVEITGWLTLDLRDGREIEAFKEEESEGFSIDSLISALNGEEKEE